MKTFFNRLSLKKQKEMRKSYVIVGLVLIILAGLLYISLKLNLDESIQKVFSSKNDGQDSLSNSNSGNENSEDGSQNSGSGSGGGGGSSSSGSSSGGESSGSTASDSSSSSNCQETLISYSLTNPSKFSNCTEYQGPTCAKKTVDCALTVQNLDRDATGLFEIRFNFFETESNILDSALVSQTLSPREIETFRKSMEFQGENADKNLTCNSIKETIPTKLVCTT